MNGQVAVAVSTMVMAVSGVTAFRRRQEIALWLQENPWLDQLPAGSVTFHFKGDSLIPKTEIIGNPRKTS